MWNLLNPFKPRGQGVAQNTDLELEAGVQTRFLSPQDAQHTSTRRGSTARGVFPDLPVCDFVSFLAIIQKLHVPMLDFEPETDASQTRGQRVIIVRAHGKNGLVFKAEPNIHNEDEANRKLLAEILIHQHPVLADHPYINALLGVTWHPLYNRATFQRIMPRLVFRDSRHGSLWRYARRHHDEEKELSFVQKLRICSHIADAIAAMHKLNIVHGDIKPQNMLIFKKDGEVLARVTDFGCTTFKAEETDRIFISGQSHDWMAPEQDQSHSFDISSAKKTDVYSFGKLCAWLLFWLDSPEEIISRLDTDTFNLGTAMDLNYFNRDGTNKLAKPEREYIEKMKPKLEAFFRSSFNKNPDERKSIQLLLLDLRRMVRAWDITFYEGLGYRARVKMRAIGTIDALRRLFTSKSQAKVSLKSRFARSRAAAFFHNAKSEVFFPGDIGLKMLASDINQARLLVVLVALICGAIGFFVFMITSFASRKQTSRVDELVPLSLLTITLGLAAFTAGRVWYLYPSRSLYRIRFKVPVFGHVSHAVPQLPELMPILNRQHYDVRRVVVEGLQARIRNQDFFCMTDGCKRMAAYQLALCWQVGFANINNLYPETELHNWLLMCGKNDATALCKEVDFWEEKYRDTRSALFYTKNLAYAAEKFNKTVEAHDSYSRNLSQMISTLENEVQMKRKSGLCLSSALVIQRSLAHLYTEQWMVEEASSAWKVAGELEAEIASRRSFGRAFQLRDRFDPELSLVWVAFREASLGHYAPAIDILKSANGNLIDPPQRNIMRLRRSHLTREDWSELATRRRALVKWLIIEHTPESPRLDEALDIAGIILDNLANSEVAENFFEGCIKISLRSVMRLAKTLAEDKTRVADAITLMRKLVELNKKFFGTGGEDYINLEGPGSQVELEVLMNDISGDAQATDESHLDNDTGGDPGDSEKGGRVWDAELELSSILSNGSGKDILEALDLQRKLHMDKNFNETSRRKTLLISIYSFALAQNGQIDDAIAALDRCLDIKHAVLGDSHPLCLGFMVDLSGSLSFDGKRSMNRAAEMQRSFLVMLKVTRVLAGQEVIQRQIIRLLWMSSMPDALEKTILEMRKFLEALPNARIWPEQKNWDQELRHHLAFILAHRGLTFEDRDNFREALLIISGFKDLEALQLRASILAHDARVQCGLHGLEHNQTQPFDDSIAAHREVLLALSPLQPTDPTVVEATVKLAIACSHAAVAFQHHGYFLEAVNLFSAAIDVADEHEPQASYHLQVLHALFSGTVDGKALRSAQKLTREWALGGLWNVNKHHPGDLVLLDHLVLVQFEAERMRMATSSETSVVNQSEVKGSKQLSKALDDLYKFRRRWSSYPDLHMDVIRARSTYGKVAFRSETPFQELAFVRETYWLSCQYHQIFRRGRDNGFSPAQIRCELDVAIALGNQGRSSEGADIADRLESRLDSRHNLLLEVQGHSAALRTGGAVTDPQVYAHGRRLRRI